LKERQADEHRRAYTNQIHEQHRAQCVATILDLHTPEVNNRRQIASYTGLCPGEYSSGNTRLQSCVTKHGNPRLRAALVELAWRLVRFQPNYKPVRKWRQILAKGGANRTGSIATGAARKKAIVAVARQLAVDLWRVRTGRCTP